MGITHLWDTNIIIYFLQGLLPPKAELFIDNTLKNGLPAISAISEIKLLCWKTEQENDLKTLHSFIRDAHVVELENSIKLKTAEIRKRNRIKIPDAIIAATDVEKNLTLLTRNIKDFKRVNGLKVIDPFAL